MICYITTFFFYVSYNFSLSGWVKVYTDFLKQFHQIISKISSRIIESHNSICNACPSEIGTAQLKPSPESTTMPVVLPDAYSDKTEGI